MAGRQGLVVGQVAPPRILTAPRNNRPEETLPCATRQIYPLSGTQQASAPAAAAAVRNADDAVASIADAAMPPDEGGAAPHKKRRTGLA